MQNGIEFAPVDVKIKSILTDKLKKIEKYLNSDVFTYWGPIFNGIEDVIKKIIEDLVAHPNGQNQEKLTVILTTTGGSAEAVERIVNILRYHYAEVNFIVPNYAYSAGTIFCMSGDNIFMSYSSVLGPIDPQVQNKDGKYVAALGYLDKVNELIEKAKNKNLTDAEFLILKDMDLAELRAYEQAKSLTIDLLNKWLVKYKFKNWTNHGNGNTVTTSEKQHRASEIGDALSNTSIWRSHSRPINIAELQKLKLQIEDYSKTKEFCELIDGYHEMFNDYARKCGASNFFHTRRYI